MIDFFACIGGWSRQPPQEQNNLQLGHQWKLSWVFLNCPLVVIRENAGLRHFCIGFTLRTGLCDYVPSSHNNKGFSVEIDLLLLE